MYCVFWRDKHTAIKGLRPPQHHAGKFHPDNKKAPPSQTKGTETIGIPVGGSPEI